MTDLTIADSGVLVAFLNRREQWHQWTLQQMTKLTPPLFTCEAVITESYFLLRNDVRAGQDILSLISDGLVQIDFSLQHEAMQIRDLMKKYENVPMSLADACLVRMSELHTNSVVFTLDSDFWIYRKNGKEEISLVIPSR